MSYSTRVTEAAAQLNYPKGMLNGQVAIITGSGQGIGAETARLFAREGAKVVISDIDAEKAKKVAEEIKDQGGSAIAVPGDMLNDDYINGLVQKAGEFGNGKIHIIINNAGFTWDGVIHKVQHSNLPRARRARDCTLTPPPTDHRQAMGHDNRAPQHRALQTRPRRRPLLPRQRQRTPLHRQHQQHIRPPRQRRPGQLRPRQSRRDGLDQNDCQRMGPCVRRARQHGGVWLHSDAADGGEGGGRVRHDAGWAEGRVGDSGRAEEGEGGGVGRIQRYSAWETGDGDGGG